MQVYPTFTARKHDVRPGITAYSHSRDPGFFIVDGEIWVDEDFTRHVPLLEVIPPTNMDTSKLLKFTFYSASWAKDRVALVAHHRPIPLPAEACFAVIGYENDQRLCEIERGRTQNMRFWDSETDSTFWAYTFDGYRLRAELLTETQ
jgi:hypothetical protein